jgi:hypothetical protein
MTPRRGERSRRVEGISSGLELLWRYHNPLGLLTYEAADTTQALKTVSIDHWNKHETDKAQVEKKMGLER